MIGDRTTGDRSGMLDSETVQGALMIAAFVVPLAVSIVLPRMIYRAVGPEDVTPAPTAITAAASSGETNEPMPTSSESPTIQNARQSHVDVLYHRGRQRLKNGDCEGAICDFDDVLRQKPEFVWCYYYRAGAYSRMGNQIAALEDLDRAAAEMPGEARVWRARAVVHQRMGDPLAAVSDIGRAVEFVGDRGGRHDAALASEVKAKAEELLTDLFEHATTALKSGDSATAIAEFSEVVRRRPESASAWLRRAVAYDGEIP